MAYLSKADLKTYAFIEDIDEITRGDDDIVLKAIKSGVGLAKSYLNRYDLVKMFSDDDTKRTFQDDFLDTMVKDLVGWFLIKLCNVNINLELARTCFEDAHNYFKKLQGGGPDPDGWPLKPNDPATPNDDAGNVEYRSLPKRTNHY